MIRTTRRAALTATAGLLALALAGCGTTDLQEDPADETAADTAAGPVSVTDQLGRTITLDSPAERVVVLEWQQVEDVLTLGVTPVGVADPDGYRQWVTAETLPEDVADVGDRAESDLDSIYALDPDLIIVEAYSTDDEQLTRLEDGEVPVLATVGADADDQIENMKEVFATIAEALGRTEQAEAVLEEFDAHLAEAKEEVADVDLDVTDFVYFDGWIDGGNVVIRPYGEGALFTELGAALGLTPAWTDEVNESYGSGGVDPAYGLAQTDIEGLTAVGDANLVYANDATTEQSYVTELEKSEIWQALPAVQEGRAYAFPPNVWGAGGPRSVMQAVDGYVEILTQG